MRSRFVKGVSVLILIALAFGALVSCTAAPAPQTAATQPAAAAKQIKGGNLEVGVLWESGNVWYDFVTAIGAGLEKDYPGTKVKYTFNNTDARPAINARWQAGDPLDVDLIFDGLDPNSYDWVTGNYLLDLTPAMNEKRADGTTWKDDILPLFLPSMSYNGKIYSAPEGVYLILLHYNKKMFDEWGLKPPKTWEELLQICETIKSKGVAPIVITGMVDYYVGMWTDYLLQRYAGKDKVHKYMYDDTDMTVANDPDFLRAFQEVKKLSDKGYLIDGWQGTDFTTSQVYFFQGKGAMILMGSWLAAEMKTTIPPDFQLAVAPFPSADSSKPAQDSVFGSAFGWSVAAKSKVPDLAIEYLRRFSSKEEAAKRAKELGVISCVKDVPAPAGINGADTTLAATANSDLIVYHWGTLSAKFGLQSAWYDPVVQMWQGKLTPEQALQKLDENMAAVRTQRKQATK